MTALESAVTDLLNYIYKQLDTVGTINTPHGPLPVLQMEQFDPLVRAVQEQLYFLPEKIVVSAAKPVDKVPAPVILAPKVALSGVSMVHGTEVGLWKDQAGLAPLLSLLANENPNRLVSFDSIPLA